MNKPYFVQMRACVRACVCVCVRACVRMTLLEVAQSQGLACLSPRPLDKAKIADNVLDLL